MLLTRPRWSSLVLALAMILASALAAALLSQVAISDAAPSSGVRSVTETIAPCRILETRGAGFGGPTGAPQAPIGAGQTLTLQVTGAAGQGGCTIGAGLTGAVLNITAVNATLDTFLTAYPCDAAARPNASTLNPFPGRITFNSAVVDLSATGTVCIYNNGGAVDVLADVTGILYDHNHDDRYLTASTYSIAQTELLVASFASGTFQTLNVSCPANTRVMGGGANNDANGAGQNIAVSSSYPSSAGGGTASNTTWRVAYRNTGAAAVANVTIRAYAICMGGAAVAGIPATVLDNPGTDIP